MILLALLHLAALGSIFPLDLPLGLKLLAGSAIACSAVASLRRHALLLASGSVRELALLADGSVEAGCRDQVRFAAGVSAQSTAFPWLVVLLLDVSSSRFMLPVVILPDSLSADEFRVVRSWLRWKVRKVSSGA